MRMTFREQVIETLREIIQAADTGCYGPGPHPEIEKAREVTLDALRKQKVEDEERDQWLARLGCTCGLTYGTMHRAEKCAYCKGGKK